MEPSESAGPGRSGAHAGQASGRSTSKVRQAILASAERIFADLMSEQKDLSAQLEFAMEQGVTEGPFTDMLGTWLQGHEEMMEARREWSALLDDQEYELIRPRFEEVFTQLTAIKRKASSYIDRLLSQTAEESTIALMQQEINDLRAELEKSRMGVATPRIEMAPRASSSRVPVSGATEPAPGFNHWSPSAVPQAELNPQATPFVPPTPVLAVPQPSTTCPVQTLPPVSESVTETTLKSVVEMMCKARQADRLPEIKPTVFEGDILEYPMWWNSFRVFVEKRTECPHERLNILGQYTKGEAHRAIAPSLHKLGEEGAYEEAKNILMSRFGDKLKLSAAYRDRLNKWPQIKADDPKALREFSDFLWQCESMRETAGYLGNLDSAEENVRFLRKLPDDMSRRWNRIVTKKMCGHTFDSLAAAGTMNYESFPTFAEFCSFVAEEARIADGPCVVKSREPRPERVDRYRAPFRRASALKTETHEVACVCACCEGGHHVSTCDKFLSLPYEDKKVIASEKHLCYGCLKTGHGVKTCRNKNYKLMNRPRKSVSMSTGVSQPLNNAYEDCRYSSLIVQAWLTHVNEPSKRMRVYVVLDTQSDTCFVSLDVARQFSVKKVPCTLNIDSMADPQLVDSEEIKGFRLQGIDSSGVVRLPEVFVRPKIPVNRGSIPRPEMALRWPHLHKIADKIAPYDSETPVAILIGYNCASAILSHKTLPGVSNEEPYGVLTQLGWSIMGQVSRSVSSGPMRAATALLTATEPKPRPFTSEDFKRAFDSDFSRPGDASFLKRSQEDAKFIEIMEKGTRFREDGHVEVPLPLREFKRPLPNSRRNAVVRAGSLKRKMDRNRKFSSEYVDYISGMEDRGDSEPVDSDDDEEDVLYLPHQGVYHPKKPDKPVRPVWDGAAETDGVSLNSLLMTGPDMGNLLTGVLIRFREEENGYTSDVEKMFMQVKVPDKQRNMQRYVWFPNGDTSKPLKDYRLTIHMFGASSSPACALYAFRAVADRYGKEYDPEVTEFIKRNFYVDDGCGSKAGVEKTVQILKQSHELCAKGGFNLRQYASNNKEVIRQIPEHLRADDMNKWLRGETVEPRLTLGMLWDFVSDTLQYAFCVPKKELTRRGMLSCLSSLYDPLGLVSPAVLPGRIILQELCKQRFQWDQPVSEEFLPRWKSWVSQIEVIATIRIPRRFRRSVHPDLEACLRIFGDACTTGLGACVYLVLRDPTGAEDRSLVAAKSRVGPVKHVTVPRLELQAAVLAVQLEEQIEAELPYELVSVDYFSDSMSALGYVYNDTKRVQLFVVNRAQKIRSRSAPSQWHHVDTEQNPADLASRGTTAEELKNSELWWSGPDSAYIKEKMAPRVFEIPDNDPEIKKEKKSLSTLVREAWLLNKFSVHSTLDKAVRSAVIVRRCIAALAKNRLQGRKEKLTPEQRLTTLTDLTLPHGVQEGQDAKLGLVRLAQVGLLPDTVAAVKSGPVGEKRAMQKCRKRWYRKNTRLHRLDPFLDAQGILRVGGRIQSSDFPESYVHPVLLPAKHFLSRLVVSDCHWKAKHSGRNITLNMVRANGWWIISGKSLVDKVLRECVTCRRLRGPLMEQKMANLPTERVSPAPPFTHTGADFLGPFLVKERRSVLKRYLCLFTCMTVRAVHLEVCDDLSTSSFWCAFRRFQDRRGPVQTLNTDRGTNFVGFHNERTRLLAEMDLDSLRADMEKVGCDLTHRFNTPQAPHKGGAWERLVGLVKSVLEPILIQHGERLNTEMLRTVATEVEAIVNSRPITAPDMSDADSLPALSPSQLLTGKVPGIQAPPPGKFPKEDLYAKEMWRRAQVVSEQFWHRWRREYLPLLQERHKWTEERPNLEVNDVVIVHDDASPRMRWPMGRIVEVKSLASDGLIRSVKVRTASGTYERAINKLVLLYRPTKEESIPVEERTI